MRQDFREIVEKELRTQGISQYRLAKMTNVAQPTINRWINGKHSINHRALEAIFEALKIILVLP